MIRVKRNIRDGEFKLEDGDVVLVYSDGLRKSLFSGESLKLIREKNFPILEEFCRQNVDSEGTVVYWCKD